MPQQRVDPRRRHVSEENTARGNGFLKVEYFTGHERKL